MSYLGKNMFWRSVRILCVLRISELWEHCFFRCLRQIEVCAHPHGSASVSGDVWTVLGVC